MNKLNFIKNCILEFKLSIEYFNEFKSITHNIMINILYKIIFYFILIILFFEIIFKSKNYYIKINGLTYVIYKIISIKF